MSRFEPAVRALCEHVRRPTTKRLMAGVALLVPAILMVEAQQPDRSGARQATADTAVITTAAESAAADSQQSAVFEAWQKKELERRNAEIAAEFAREYKIPETLAKDIHETASEVGISPNVAFGLVQAESSFRTKAISPVGAVGLTQLMPATARWLEPGTTRKDLMEPRTNLQIGFKYLKQLIADYDGNERLALTAYNRGPGTVNRLIRRGRNPDNGYADKVLTGRSAKHVALMNAKFGKSRRGS